MRMGVYKRIRWATPHRSAERQPGGWQCHPPGRVRRLVVAPGCGEPAGIAASADPADSPRVGL